MSRYKAYPEYKDSETKWLGKIPIGWQLFDGKRLFGSRRETALDGDEQLAASQKYGVVPQGLMMELNDSKVMLALKGTSSFRHVSENDFVISLRSFEGGIEHSRYVGCVSPAYTVLHAQKDIIPNYFKYLLKSSPYVAALQASTDSLRDGKSISYEQFGAIPLPYPEPIEQSCIAAFLDHETAKIDALIEKQQRLIELLKEKRQAVISHAVTRGLNPNAPMKDSGVEWLGEVPAHWSVVPMKFVCEVKDGTHDTPQYVDKSDDAFPLVTSKDFSGDSIFFDGAKYISKEDHTEILRRSNTENGDVLMSMIGGNIGKALIVKTEQSFSIKNVALFKSGYCENLSKFIFFYFQSGLLDIQISLVSRGGAQDFLSLGDLRNLVFFKIPEDELSIIVKHIMDKVSVFDVIIDGAERMIGIMQERCTALISAAVTGKIDVRDWQVPA